MRRTELLNKYLKYWQRVLNLQQWDLRIKLVNFKRTDYPQSGDIEINLKNKSATILIIKEATGKDSAVILHELIHLILQEFDHFIEAKVSDNKKNEYFNLLEKTVADLARIFLEQNKL